MKFWRVYEYSASDLTVTDHRLTHAREAGGRTDFWAWRVERPPHTHSASDSDSKVNHPQQQDQTTELDSDPSHPHNMDCE